MRWIRSSMRLVCGLALGSSLLGPAPVAARTVLVQQGPEGEDSSPYGFLPLLARGTYVTNYAFTEEDGHIFETYLKIPLPANLLGPGEVVTKAELWVSYALDFEGFGETSDEPGRLDVHPVLTPWSEATLTYSSRPAIGAAVATVSGISELQTLRIPVTDLVRSWAFGATNHGFALTSPTKRVMGFHAFEANVSPALKALLVITVEAGSGSPDFDADGHVDASDVCPTVADPTQADIGGVGVLAGPDGIGDACQCGDVTGDGRVTASDVAQIQRALLAPPMATLGRPEHCDVGGSAGCTLEDVAIMRRALLVPPAAMVGQQCETPLP